MTIAVVIPAHNEERLIGRCLASIHRAAARASTEATVTVVANRCTDGTADVAESLGARVVTSEARNLASVRNTGIAAGAGEIVVTVDADGIVHPDTFREVTRRLHSGSYVGGGVRVIPERWSAGIAVTYALMEAITAVTRVAGGLYWARRDDVEAVGGFDESVLVGEDVAFARRLRSRGRATGRRFTCLRSTPLTASCRKFDAYGDWHMLTMARDLPAVFRSRSGRDTEWVDRYFFDFND